MKLKMEGRSKMVSREIVEYLNTMNLISDNLDLARSNEGAFRNVYLLGARIEVDKFMGKMYSLRNFDYFKLGKVMDSRIDRFIENSGGNEI